ncbi:hypothetical protein CRUP_010311 [Coryphaenoides rupestris]|nr:hypothetical protein CRUP_010311 [Coryphaenoides rupestris]
MADPSAGWWKLTYLRKRKSQPEVQYEILGEDVSVCNTPTPMPTTSTASLSASTADSAQDSELSARLERMDLDTTSMASKGHHVKVSHSGRFKEKRRQRAALGGNADGASVAEGTRTHDQNHDQNHDQMAGK